MYPKICLNCKTEIEISYNQWGEIYKIKTIYIKNKYKNVKTKLIRNYRDVLNTLNDGEMIRKQYIDSPIFYILKKTDRKLPYVAYRHPFYDDYDNRTMTWDYIYNEDDVIEPDCNYYLVLEKDLKEIDEEIIKQSSRSIL